MKDPHEMNHWIKTHGDLALDLVRMYLGIGLVLKAIFFMTHSEYLAQLMQEMGSMWFAPAMVVHYVVVAHFVGGLCLAFGLLTRIAAIAQLPILASALFWVHLPKAVSSVESRQSLEFAGLVLFLLCIISVYGAGRWSVDYWLGRNTDAHLYRTDPLPKAT